MKAIYKRELKAYFHSMTGWLFLAANIFLSGLYFFALNLRFGYSSLANTISYSDNAYGVGGKEAEDRSADPDLPGIRRQGGIGQISGGGQHFYPFHTGDSGLSSHPVPIRRRIHGRELYGSAGLLFIWPDLYCHRTVYFFRDRKPGNRCGAELRRSFSGIYDGQYNRTDFFHGKSVYPDFECL